MTKDEVKAYALERYPHTFTSEKVHRDMRGKVTKREKIELDPIVTEEENFWLVQKTKDSSPIILSKNI